MKIFVCFVGDGIGLEIMVVIKIVVVEVCVLSDVVICFEDYVIGFEVFVVEGVIILFGVIVVVKFVDGVILGFVFYNVYLLCE